jgi:hypothetical protein
MHVILCKRYTSNQMEDIEKVDEILGIVRCARCGHRLEDEIECPFCSLFQNAERRDVLQKWVYITACFLTSPLSIYFIFKGNRLNFFEKGFSALGCLLWFALYLLWF